ncbi:MAG: KamA family radical SAM protein [Deltaproteobacteria bacterium]|nr:KamA family radical SAM protein [Deltaproteobacteria bacterium]
MNPERYNPPAGPWEKVSPARWSDWRWQYRNRVRTLTELASLSGGPFIASRGIEAVTEVYPLAVTPYYFSLMRPGCEKDPVRLQAVPDAAEIDITSDSLDDPLGEERFMPVPGLVHRYRDRCLAIVTNRCATYCRHCNRKRMWGHRGKTAGREALGRMIAYVSETRAIREVIVSGGDPLTLDDGLLEGFLRALRAIPHVEILRLGSRTPVVMPMRITARLSRMLRRYRPLWFNTQFNHPREMTTEAARACEMLLDAGIPLSNQSVLLRGVNDDYDTMRDLVHGLQRLSVRPYYLFQCDPVRGTDHFRAEIAKGLSIMDELRRNTSGLCLPHYVLDVPGERAKIHLQSEGYALSGGAGQHFFDNRRQID